MTACAARRSGENTTLLALAVFALILIASVLYTKVFSGRGAFIHVGALVGTIMAVNVFAVIIPNQKKMIAQMIARRRRRRRATAQIGKQRSIHNNYLTLPVLLMMVSPHYPFLFTHPQSWLIVALIIVIGALVRHMLNRIDAERRLGQLRLGVAGSGNGADHGDLCHCAGAAPGRRRARSERHRGADDHRQALRDVPFQQADASGIQGAAEEYRARQRSRDAPFRAANLYAERCRIAPCRSATRPA